MIPVDPESGSRNGPPSLVLDVGSRFNVGAEDSPRRNDVSLDGERFLVIGGPGAEASENASDRSIIFVQNWFEELKARVPVK